MHFSNNVVTPLGLSIRRSASNAHLLEHAAGRLLALYGVQADTKSSYCPITLENETKYVGQDFHYFARDLERNGSLSRRKPENGFLLEPHHCQQATKYIPVSNSLAASTTLANQLIQYEYTILQIAFIVVSIGDLNLRYRSLLPLVATIRLRTGSATAM